MILTEIQFLVLRELYYEDRTTRELKKDIKWNKSNASFYELMQRLEERGMVKIIMNIDEYDNEIKRYFITDEGKKSVKETVEFYSL